MMRHSEYSNPVPQLKFINYHKHNSQCLEIRQNTFPMFEILL